MAQCKRADWHAAAWRAASSSVQGLCRFLRLPVAMQAQLLEAASALLLARLLVVHVPMRYWRRRLDTATVSALVKQRPAPSHPAVPASPQTDPLVKEPATNPVERPCSFPLGLRDPHIIGRLVRKVARRLPFQVRCLPQAMAAQWMLRRRGVSSRLVFGARRSQPPERTIEYHAWLMVAGQCVIGGEELETYVPLPPPHPDNNSAGASTSLKCTMGAHTGPQRHDSSAPTPPFAGMLAGLRLTVGVGTSATDRAALERVVDWKSAAALADHHGVASLLLSSARTVPAASTAAVAALTALRQRTNIRGLRQLAGLRQATELLASNGIPALVLKGLPLSVRLYGTPLARDCIDIDLLVPPDTVAHAARVLSRGGWQLLKPSFRSTPARDRCHDRFVKDRVFLGPGGILELHHRLFSNPFLLQAPFDSLYANAAHVDLNGCPFAALGDDDLLVYLAVHGQLHRWNRLKWLCDLAKLLASIDDDRFRAAIERCRREKLQLETVLGATILLCQESFHVDLPKASASVPVGARAGRAATLTRRLWNAPRREKDFQGVPRSIDVLRLALAMKPSRRLATHELSRWWLAPCDFDRVDLPDSLFFLYAPLRPVLWLAKRLWPSSDTAPSSSLRKSAPPEA